MDPFLFVNLSKRYSTPLKVQKWLRKFHYNREKNGETLRSAKQVFLRKEAHCLEASLIAAAILEHQGYPPLLLCLDSLDNLNHTVFIFKTKTGWGAVGRSREPGLHGRAPRFRTVKALAQSYSDPFVDKTGRLLGYHVVNLNDIPSDWRFSDRNVWKVDQVIVKTRYLKLKSSKARFLRLRKKYWSEGPIPNGKFWW